MNRQPDSAWAVDEERQGGLLVVPDAGAYGEIGYGCPICESVFMHVEDWARPDIRDKDAFYSFTVWGECGHRLMVTLNEHKGALFLVTRRLPDQPADGPRAGS